MGEKSSLLLLLLLSRFVLSVIKKEKLQNILAPDVYHEWAELFEKIEAQWCNSDTF